ncbi:MAG: hypothetical protein HY903_11630 [Deltaproteobacteria bacterium]|nr:hypothetical protein [Deltaproteobacteria bacterium]
MAILDLQPAARYEPVADLGIVTSYFNPSGFASKRANYERFVAPMRAAGFSCRTIECAFGEAPFELGAHADVIRVRSRSVMFQKERLLNLAIGRLPPTCTKVAWIDGDVLFTDPLWAVRASERLDTCQVIQPFDTAYRLPPRVYHYDGSGIACRSFAATFVDDPEAFARGNFHQHGDTGFAWAARRQLVAKHGLYDAMILGSADHVMGHAVLGDWTSGCIRTTAGVNNPCAADLRAWGRRFYADAKGSLGFAAGSLLHLWHGKAVNRRYVERTKKLVGFGFDPKTDLRIGESGAWEWASPKPELHTWVEAYFRDRQEDDEEGEA